MSFRVGQMLDVRCWILDDLLGGEDVGGRRADDLLYGETLDANNQHLATQKIIQYLSHAASIQHPVS